MRISRAVVVTVVAAVCTLMLQTACTSESSDSPDRTAEPARTVRAVVDVDPSECKPANVPGNCWLPLYTAPVVSGSGKDALNATDECNSDSQDQTGCWPQPGTTLTVQCWTVGVDGRPWYAIVVPNERITNPDVIAPSDGIIGYASSRYLSLQSALLVRDGSSYPSPKRLTHC